MTFADQIRSTPEVFIFGALVWIPIAGWTISMIHMMVMGDIDVISGFLAICVAMALGVITIRPPEPYLSPVCFGAVVSMVLFYPLIRANMTKRAMVKIDLEHLERMHENLRMRPDNNGTKFKIAAMLYERGYVSHAMALAENIAEDMPHELYPDENKLLRRWREETKGRLSSRSIPCPKCGAYNGPGGYLCSKCGAEYLLLSAKGNWLTGFWGTKFLGAWIVAVIGIVGIPAVASLGLPTWALVTGVMVLLAGAVFVLLRAFVQRFEPN